MKRKGFQLQDLTAETILDIAEIYLTEWIHRSDVLWSHIFKFFYANMVVLFLPNLSYYLGIDLPKFPTLYFRMVSLIMSLVFLYVSVGYLKRLEAVAKSYYKIINFLPTELRQVTLQSSEIKYGKYFNFRMSILTVFYMFLALISMSIVMIIYDLTSSV